MSLQGVNQCLDRQRHGTKGRDSTAGEASKFAELEMSGSALETSEQQHEAETAGLLESS